MDPEKINNENDVDDIFREALGQTKIEPPEEFWNEVSEQILARSSNSVESSTYHWKRLAYLLMAIVAVLSSFVFYFYNQSENKNINKSIASSETITNSNAGKNELSSEPQKNRLANTGNKAPNNKKDILIAPPSVNTINIVGAGNITKNNEKLQETGNTINSGTYSGNTKQNEHTVALNKRGNKNSGNGNSSIGSDSNTGSIEKSSSSTISSNIVVSTTTINKTDTVVSSLSGITPIISLHKDSTSLSKKIDSVKNPVSTNADSLAAKTLAHNHHIEPKDSLNLTSTGSGLSLSVFFAPDMMDRYSFKGGSYGDMTSSNLKNAEKNNFSYATGAKAEFALSSHFSISAGLLYRVFSFTYSPQEVYYLKQTDGTMGYAVITSSGIVKCPYYEGSQTSTYLWINGTASRDYIGIPLQLKYRFALTDKLSGYVTAGGVANFAIHSVTVMNWQDNSNYSGVATVNSMGSLKTAYYSGYFGLGSAYRLSDHFSIYVEPSMQGGMTPINKNSPIISYQYSAFLAFGVTYHLN